MINRTIAIICSVGLLAGATAHAQKAQADAAAAMAQAMAALGQMAEGAQGGAAAGVDTKELRALLPEKDAFKGFKRVKASTERNGMMGFQITVARAEFEALDGGASFSVQYSDVGTLGGFAKMAFSIHEIDEETEHGFKRTTKYDGFKALEEFDGNRGKSGNIKIHTGDQVFVEVDANGLDFEAIKNIVSKIDLKKIAALKPVPAAAEQ